MELVWLVWLVWKVWLVWDSRGRGVVGKDGADGVVIVGQAI